MIQWFSDRLWLAQEKAELQRLRRDLPSMLDEYRALTLAGQHDQAARIKREYDHITWRLRNVGMTRG